MNKITLLMLTFMIVFTPLFAQDHSPNHPPEYGDTELGQDDMKDNPNRGPHRGPPRSHKSRRESQKGMRIFQLINKEMPQLSAKLKVLKTDNPQIIKLFFRQLKNKSTKPLLMGLKKNKNNDKKTLIQKYFNNELDSLILANEYRKTQNKPSLEKLTKLINESFDIKVALQKDYCEQMTKRIQELKDKIETRTELKDKIVSQRIEELTADNEVIAW